MAARAHFFRWEDQPLDKVTEMVARKAIRSAHATLTQAYLKKGAVVPQHVRTSDITIYVLQGALRLRVEGDEDLLLREGEVAVVPAGVRYQTESLEDTFVLTVTGA
jgi:quercetin dioxygenase-like cupin family protein